MNKDFLTKPISLKDIKLPKIDTKNIKNNKLIIICIFTLIFICVICIIGSNLIDANNTATIQNESAKRQYETLKNALPIEEIQANTEKINNEISLYEEKLKSVTGKEFSEILNEFRKGAPIKWDESEVEVRLLDASSKKEFKNYDVYRVDIKSFSGTLSEIENFLTYVENYDKLVRIDSIKFNKNKITGKLVGSTSLYFYFKMLEE